MKIIKACFLLFVLALISCNHSHGEWTEEQRKEFKCKCKQTDTFKNIVIEFRGYDSKEFDSVLIREYKDSVLLDSFKMYVFPSQSPDQKRDKERSGDISHTMNIHHRYEFIIPGNKPFELSNMKMVMWAQYTMNSEGWGCVMAEYTLNGVEFHDSPNPRLEKY